MKKLLLSAVVCTAFASVNVNASLKSAENFKFVGDTEYAGLCHAAAINDLSLFKENVKQHGFRLSASHSKMMKLLTTGDNFQCAEQDLVSFSQTRGSLDIANYLTASKASPSTAATEQYKFVGDKSFKNFCKSALTNNVGLFKRAISSQVGTLGFTKKEVMNKVLEADNVTCAGQALPEFFQSREATKVLNYIADKAAQ